MLFILICSYSKRTEKNFPYTGGKDKRGLGALFPITSRQKGGSTPPTQLAWLGRRVGVGKFFLRFSSKPQAKTWKNCGENKT